MTWATLRLQGDPLLVIAFRDKRSALTGRLVSIDRNLHAPLHEIGREALRSVVASESVSYTPYVDAGEGEHLEIDPSRIARLQRPPGRRGPNPSQVDPNASVEEQETVMLLDLVSGADYLEPIGAGQILDTLPESFYAQIICLADERGARVGFVTKTNPRNVIKRTWIPLGRGDNSDRLKRVAPPRSDSGISSARCRNGGANRRTKSCTVPVPALGH